MEILLQKELSQKNTFTNSLSVGDRNAKERDRSSWEGDNRAGLGSKTPAEGS